jgi:hypothetical protein
MTRALPILFALIIGARQASAQRQPDAPICLKLQYAPSRNREAAFFPTGLQYSAVDSFVHFWWDSHTADVRELQKQTSSRGRWRLLGQDSISTVVYSSMDEASMSLVFVIAPDRHYAAVSTHSIEDPAVPAVSARVNCRTREPDRRPL